MVKIVVITKYIFFFFLVNFWNGASGFYYKRYLWSVKINVLFLNIYFSYVIIFIIPSTF